MFALSAKVRWIVLISLLAACSCAQASGSAHSPAGPSGRVATFGIVRIRPTDTPGDASIQALHVRLVITDDATVPWFLDTREQRVVLGEKNQSRPAYASNAVASPPVIQIPPGATRTIDLFFPLPVSMPSGTARRFDVIWQVHAGSRVIGERTPFDRVTTATYDPQFAFGGYWYDPSYPAGTFVGAGALPAPFVEHPVYIARDVARGAR